MVSASLPLTGGRIIYTLDDPYIHMAMAKNLVRHAVWGVTPFGFTSSSSSPLWLILLTAVYRVGGVSEIAPLALNLFFAVTLLLLAYTILRRFALRSITIALLLFSLILFVPVVPVSMCGLEHMLHATLSLAFLFLAAEVIDGDLTGMPSIALLCLAPLLTGARYEGMFLVAGAALLFLIRRRFWYAVALGAAAAVPVVAYGIFSMAKGWSFLPNSLLLKGNIPHSTLVGLLKLIGLSCYNGLARNPHLLVLVIAGLAILYLLRARTGSLRGSSAIMLLLTLVATLLHLQFARAGWFYRYEAYLMAMWIVAIGSTFPVLGREFAAVLGLGKRAMVLALSVVVVAAAPLFQRGIEAYGNTPRATRNIYEQQYQMGLFLREFYQGRGVAANDIGAINFLADIDNLDLWGLASIEVARAKLAGTYNAARIRELAIARNIGIAIVYDEWFTEYGGIPRSWIKVGQWEIRDNVVAGGPVVSFYATDPIEASYLASSLRTFSRRLPATVIQRGAYTERH